jgi:hypothetical protein
MGVFHVWELRAGIVERRISVHILWFIARRQIRRVKEEKRLADNL